MAEIGADLYEILTQSVGKGEAARKKTQTLGRRALPRVRECVRACECACARWESGRPFRRAHTQHTPGRRACTFNQSILRSPSGEKVARPLFPLPRSPVLVLLALARSLARSPVRARHKGHTGGGGRRGGARGSRLPPHRSAAPAAPAPPAGAPRLGGRARCPGCSSAAPTRARTPAEPGAAALPHPAPGVMKATKVTSSGGAGEGAHTHPAACAPARARRGRLAPAPFSTAPHTLPRVRAKKKIQVSPPPIFSFLFSLSFVPLSHSHSLLQSEMPRDSPSSRFRVTCPLFSPGLSFLLFPRGAEKWGRNPFCPFPSPDLFHKTRVRFLLSIGLLTFILTQKNK